MPCHTKQLVKANQTTVKGKEAQKSTLMYFCFKVQHCRKFVRVNTGPLPGSSRK